MLFQAIVYCFCIILTATRPACTSDTTAIVCVSGSDGVDTPACIGTANATTVAWCCRSLSYALQGIIIMSKDSTVLSVEVRVPSGWYNLTNLLLEFNNVNQLAITGTGINDTVIHCSSDGNGSSLVFSNSTDITITNVTFIGCGYRFTSDSSVSHPALSFIACTNVSLINVNVTMSLDSALKFYSCLGEMVIANSTFTDNGLNNITTKGGAIEMTIDSNISHPVTITIESCLFTGNRAAMGGAVYIETGEQSAASSGIAMVNVLISNTSFISNSALNDIQYNTDTQYNEYSNSGISTGGGVLLTVADSSTFITMTRSTVTHNTANTGAGVIFLIRHARSSIDIGDGAPVLIIRESVFDSNMAVSVGAALVLTPVIINHDGFRHWVSLERNVFVGNEIGSIETSSTSETGVGTVVVGYVNVVLTGINEFRDNQGSGIVLLNAMGKFESESETHFINNTGFNGGAMQIYDTSTLLISSNCSLSLIGNTAVHQGGAVYHHTPGSHIGTLLQDCFVIFNLNNTGNFTFQDNRARNRLNAIYSNALLNCMIPYANNDVTLANKLILCQPNWQYISSNCTESVQSEPASFTLSNSTDRFGIFSGTPAILPVVVNNVLGGNVTEDIALYVSTIDTNSLVSTNPSSGVISNNTVELNADEGTTGIIRLRTTDQLPYKGINIPFNVRSCPPGFRVNSNINESHHNGEEGARLRCQCVEGAFEPGTITCDNAALTSRLMITSCISQLDANDSTLVAGSCPFLLGSATSATIPLPQDPSRVEEVVCGAMNRRGILCGQCMEGYVPEAYSYQYNCIKCDSIVTSWLVYLAAQYIPIIVMFILISFLNLTIVSPASNAFLFTSQVSSLSNAFVINSFISRYAFGEGVGTALAVGYNTINGIWNIDFFRAFLPPICLYTKQDALFVVFIEYFAAFFPFVMVIIAYFTIILYNKNFRPLVWLWKPASFCLSKLQANFKPRASLIDVFVTFFVLSYLKITATAFRFLQFVFVHDLNGSILDVVFFYNGNIKLFHGIHIPFGILAIITILTITLVPPILLTCYQFKWFQRVLEKCHLRSQALVTFVEVLQSGFTDGRNGTKDRRFFAAFYFILRIAIFGPTTVIPQVFVRTIVPITVYSVGIIALVVYQPYQNNFFNKVDILILLNILVTSFIVILSLILALSGASNSSITPLMGLSYALSTLPMIYMSWYVVRWLLVTIKVWKQSRTDDNVRTSKVLSASLFSVPDRVIRPALYQSLVIDKGPVDPRNTETDQSTGRTITEGRANGDGNEAGNEAVSRVSGLHNEHFSTTYELSSYSNSINND